MKNFRLLLLSAFFIVPFSAICQERNADEVIGKHIAAIGSPEKRELIKNQLLLGDIDFTFKGSAQIVSGKALVLSSAEKILWGMNFNSNDYPQDRFSFNGKQVKIGRATPSARSLLGEFLYNHTELLKEGLFGGTLSNSWALLRAKRTARIEHDGTKIIDGKKSIVLTYAPRGGSDVSIKLYFDDQSGHHIRTEYTVVRNAGQGPTVDSSAGQSGTIFRLVEEFLDHRKMGDLNLPGTYRITYARSGTAAVSTAQRTNREAEWTFKVTDFGANREIDDKSFDIDG